MPDDRLQLPDSLEKAFDYAKQQPADWELAKKRALTWEQVSAKGRRLQRWSRWWKPLTGVVAAAVMVLAAVVVSPHLLGGSDLNKRSVASTPQVANRASQATPAPNWDMDAHIRLDAQLGQQFISYDPQSGYDLVLSMQEANNSRELSVVRNGVVHPIVAIPAEKKVQPILSMNSMSPLIGYTLGDNSPYGDGETQDSMYFINTDTLKLGSISVDNSVGDINQIGVSDQRPSKITVFFSQVDPKTGVEQVFRWGWGDGEPKSLLTHHGDVLKGIITDTASPILYFPHQMYQVENDGSLHLIDDNTKLSMEPVSGLDRNEQSGFLYALGSFPNPSFGIYSGDQQLKLYSFATGTSQALLPGVSGDEVYVDSLKGSKFLLQSFTADDPVKAQQMQVSKVPGELELWYAQPGQAPILVYQTHEIGEKFVSVSVKARPEGLTGYHTVIVINPNSAQPKVTLDFDWSKLTFGR